MKKIILILLCLLSLFACSSKVKKYEGEYSDTYSMRANMACSAIGDKLYIEITWSSSAEETTQWQMSATLKDNYLVYNDCIKTVISMKDGMAKSIVEYDNVSGSFTVKDDILYWTGAKELENARCVFEKVKK